MDLMQTMLENRIKKYQREYYKGTPLISDEELDNYINELENNK